MAEVDLTTKLKAFPKIKSIEVTGDNSVTLKWSKVALAEKYDIKRSESPSGPFAHVEWSKKPEFTDETVEKNITYWYKVIAWKRMEGKKTSTKASAVKPIVISDISAVNNLKAEEKSGKICLSWDKGESDSFYIYRRSDHFSRLVCIGETEKTCFTDEAPVSGQTYHYTVQGSKKGEEKSLHGNFSTEVDCVFLDCTEIISFKKNTLNGKVSLSVRLVAGCDGYIFERSKDKDGAFTEVGRTEEITANTFEEKLSGKEKGSVYRVCAYKTIGGKEFRGKYSPVKGK